MAAYFNSSMYAEVITTFKSDCDELTKTFQEMTSQRYSDYSRTWKAFRFSLVYEKYLKKYPGDDRFFKEDCLQIAKKIMLNGHFVGGVFLLYSLYYMQEHPKCLIRIERSEFNKLIKLVKQDRLTRFETSQPGLQLSKLMRHGAFIFNKFSREYSVQGQNRIRLVYGGQQTPEIDLSIKLTNAWFEEFLEETNNLEEVKNIESGYIKKKQQIVSDFPELNLTLDLKPEDFITGLRAVSNTAGTSTMNPSEHIGAKRQTLKNRKMKIKHRYQTSAVFGSSEFKVKEECSTKDVKNSNSRRRKGRYFVTANRRFRDSEIHSDEEEDRNVLSDDSDEDDPILSLPDIIG